MGLDMYLIAKRMDPSSEKLQQLIEEIMPEATEHSFSFTSVAFEVAYWRKANAIHNWFVQHVQDNVDNCEHFFVTIEQLEELVDVVNQVLTSPEKAPELLPTVSGLFFGSQEYDEFYFEDLRSTTARLTPIIKDERFQEHWAFYYRSSW
jgi:hypothetical protein